MMKLDVGGARKIDAPTEQHLAEALDSLETLGTRFVILIDDSFENDFMQAAILDEGLIVEFRDGDSGRHYRSEKGMTREAALALFLAYRRQQNSYMKNCPWKDITDLVRRTRRNQLVAWIIGIVVLGLLLFGIAYNVFGWRQTPGG